MFNSFKPSTSSQNATFTSSAMTSSAAASFGENPEEITKKQNILNHVFEECKARMVYKRELIEYFKTTSPILNGGGEGYYYQYGRYVFAVNKKERNQVISPNEVKSFFIDTNESSYVFYKFILEILEKKPKNYVDILCLLFETQILEEESMSYGSLGAKRKLTSSEKDMCFEGHFLEKIKKMLEKAADSSYRTFRNVVRFSCCKNKGKKGLTIDVNFSYRHVKLLEEKYKYIESREPKLALKNANLEKMYLLFRVEAVKLIKDTDSNITELCSRIPIASKEINKGPRLSLGPLKTLLEDCRATFEIAESFSSQFEAIEAKYIKHLAFYKTKETFFQKLLSIDELAQKALLTREDLAIKIHGKTVELNKNIKICQLENSFTEDMNKKLKYFHEKAAQVCEDYSIENHEDAIATFTLIIEESKALKYECDEFSIKKQELLEELKEEHIKKYSNKVSVLNESENKKREKIKQDMQEIKKNTKNV